MARYDNPQTSVFSWMLIAGGVYLVAKYFGIDPLAGLFGATATVPAGGSPTSNTGGTATTTNNTSTSIVTQGTPDTKGLVMAKMIEYHDDPNQLWSVDQFNVYYRLVRGLDGPGQQAIFPGDPQGKRYSIHEYWDAMSKGGFSGFGTIAMGPFRQFYNPPRGRGVTPTGFELLRKVM